MRDSRDDVAATRCQRAVELFNRGKREEALRELQDLSERGYSPAQTFLGWTREYGHGVPRSTDEALRLYTAAAEAGDAVAQYYLAMMLLKRGATESGANWMRRAAGEDYAPALYRLGRLYTAGNGVERDESRGVECIEKAANLGHLFAQRWIAIRRLRGHEGLNGVLRGVGWFFSVPRKAIQAVLSRETDENLIHP